MRSLKSSSSPTVPDGLIQIGKIIGAHGIGGAVRVYSYAESEERFSPRSHLTFITPSGEASRHRITKARFHKKVVRLWLDDITTRDQAETLVDVEVCCHKKDLPPLEPDTYYWDDLIGMAVYDVDDQLLGRIVQIIPTGANDVYVVKTDESQPVAEILIPAIASVVLDVDIQKGRMRVKLPEGLI